MSKKVPKLATLWQLGFTKVFLKEDTRIFLEQELNTAIMHHILIIQAGAKGCLARKLAKKRLKARDTIKNWCHRVILFNRFRKVALLLLSKAKASIALIKRSLRRYIMHKKLMTEINQRVIEKRK